MFHYATFHYFLSSRSLGLILLVYTRVSFQRVYCYHSTKLGRPMEIVVLFIVQVHELFL